MPQGEQGLSVLRIIPQESRHPLSPTAEHTEGPEGSGMGGGPHRDHELRAIFATN